MGKRTYIFAAAFVVCAVAVAVVAPTFFPFAPRSNTADEFRAFPGVERVEVSPANGKASRRIVHVLDFHHVPREDLEPGTDYGAFLSRVAVVQEQQLAFLRALRPKAVFVEGITQEGLADFNDLRRAVLDVLAVGGEKKLDRETLLALGVTARLPGVEVLPLDDAKLLDAAHPHKAGAAAIDRRREGIVRNVLAHGGGVIVLGSSHDLTATVRRIAPDCEYVRVWVKGLPK